MRVWTGLPSWHTTRCHLHLQARAGAGRRLRHLAQKPSQELHAKIARVIEARFSSIKATEPEVLAHHLTAAGLTEAAIPLWQAAGELALKRVALTEAIPSQSGTRTGPHPALVVGTRRRRIGAAYPTRHRVGGAQGLGRRGGLDSLHPALALAKSLERHDSLLPSAGD